MFLFCLCLLNGGKRILMKYVEQVKVYANIQHGKVVCLCLYTNKRCEKDCEKTVLIRDRYYGWQKTFRQNRFGKNF